MAALRGIQLVKALFEAVRFNPRRPMNQPRLMGKHCRARLLRGQAKRRKAGKTVFNP